MVRSLLNAFGLSVLLLGAALPGGAEAAGATTKSVGVWVLKVEDGSRQCRVTLRADMVESGYALGMPVGCHRAFPILTGVTTWAEPDEGRLAFADAHGQPVLAFEESQDGTLAGTGPQGDQYRLEPVGTHKALVLKVAAQKSVAPAPDATAPDPARPTPKVADMPGHYAVLRDKARDTGCMVTLDGKARGPKGMLKANLAPACRDEGIRIFDPVAWEVVGGRLVLMARKGHTTKLDLQEDGTWLKDPKDGKSMGLKRL